MNCLYFDCFSGISGDMTLGALIDLGMPAAHLKRELGKLDLTGYTIRADRTEHSGISGRQVKVNIKSSTQNHHHRTYRDIEKIISKSMLSETVKQRSLNIFLQLAKAEAKIHHKKAADVHFHEVGAIDSIVDIVGCAVGLDYLKIERCHASAIPLGHGFVTCRHGTIPIPAPATLELLKDTPVYDAGIEAELVTPTGAAILAALVSSFGSLPAMTVKKTGYGAGTRRFETRPNLLRAVLGETLAGFSTDAVTVLETNIDDMNPELTGYLMDRLFAEGALDVILIPVHMKKNRPGVLLQVICTEHDQQRLSLLIFRESTTAGIRSYHAERSVLKRRTEKTKTHYGQIKVKILAGPDGKNIIPEYEECRRVAREKNVALKTVYREVTAAAERSRRRK
ncbi:MAG: nickel pincer cofactor biosynthesis protein LarC [bacterium]|nr:nickel pincer cofactor biosynthesis protein LarC [bacterium]